MLQRTEDDGHDKRQGNQELRSEGGERRLPDQPGRTAVLRLFGHMDAQCIRHGIGDGDRQNATDYDRPRMGTGVQPDHQPKGGNDS